MPSNFGALINKIKANCGRLEAEIDNYVAANREKLVGKNSRPSPPDVARLKTRSVNVELRNTTHQIIYDLWRAVALLGGQKHQHADGNVPPEVVLSLVQAVKAQADADEDFKDALVELVSVTRSKNGRVGWRLDGMTVKLAFKDTAACNAPKALLVLGREQEIDSMPTSVPIALSEIAERIVVRGRD